MDGFGCASGNGGLPQMNCMISLSLLFFSSTEAICGMAVRVGGGCGVRSVINLHLNGDLFPLTRCKMGENTNGVYYCIGK